MYSNNVFRILCAPLCLCLLFLCLCGGAGITGKVSIDENGDRNADYSLLDLDPDTGFFEVGSEVIVYQQRSATTC